MYICDKCNKKWKDEIADENEYVCTKKCSGILILQEMDFNRKNRISSYISLLICISAAFYLWIDYLYLHSFWYKIVAVDLLLLLMPVTFVGLFTKPRNLKQTQAQNVRYATIGWCLVLLASVIIYINEYYSFSTFNEWEDWQNTLLAIIGISLCIALALRHKRYLRVYWRMRSSSVKYMPIVMLLLVIGSFKYESLIGVALLFGLGFIVIIRMGNRQVKRILSVLSNLKGNSINFGETIQAVYSAHPEIDNKQRKESLSTINDLDGEESANINSFLIDGIDIEAVEDSIDRVGLDECFKHFDLFLLEFSDIYLAEEKDVTPKFLMDLSNAIESPRTQILLLFETIKSRPDGLPQGSVDLLQEFKEFINTSFGLSIIQRKKIKYGAAVNDSEIRTLILQQMLDKWRLNVELFTAVSNKQYDNIRNTLACHISPISCLVLRFLRSDSIIERYYVLINLYEAQSRWLATIALAIAERSNLEIYSELLEFIDRPSMGKWGGVVQRVEKASRDSEQTPAIQLLSNWCKPVEPLASLSSALETIAESTGVKRQKTKGMLPLHLIEAVVSLRNKTIGHGSVTFEVANNLANTVFIAFCDLLDLTHYNNGAELLSSTDNSEHNYIGMKSLIINNTREKEINVNPGVHAVWDTETLSLTPWIMVDDMKKTFWFYNCKSKSSYEYLSYETGSLTKPSTMNRPI